MIDFGSEISRKKSSWGVEVLHSHISSWGCWSFKQRGQFVWVFKSWSREVGSVVNSCGVRVTKSPPCIEKSSNVAQTMHYSMLKMEHKLTFMDYNPENRDFEKVAFILDSVGVNLTSLFLLRSNIQWLPVISVSLSVMNLSGLVITLAMNTHHAILQFWKAFTSVNANAWVQPFKMFKWNKRM